MCSTHNIKYNISYSRTNSQDNGGYVLVFYVAADVLFSQLGKLKIMFSHTSISLYEICTKDYRVFWIAVIVYRTEIKAKNSFSWDRYIKYANFVLPVFIYIYIWIICKFS